MVRREISEDKDDIKLAVSHDPHSDAVENVCGNILLFVEKFQDQAVTRLVVLYLEMFEFYRVITRSQEVSTCRTAVQVRAEALVDLVSDSRHKTFREVVLDMGYRVGDP